MTCPSRTGSSTSSCADGRWRVRTLGRETRRGSQVTLGKAIRSTGRSWNSLLITPIRPIATMRCLLEPSTLVAFQFEPTADLYSEIQRQGRQAQQNPLGNDCPE